MTSQSPRSFLPFGDFELACQTFVGGALVALDVRCCWSHVAPEEFSLPQRKLVLLLRHLSCLERMIQTHFKKGLTIIWLSSGTSSESGIERSELQSTRGRNCNCFGSFLSWNIIEDVYTFQVDVYLQQHQIQLPRRL